MNRPTVAEITKYLNEWSPFDTAEEFDNVGHSIGDPNCKVCRVLVALDITMEVLEQAAAQEVELIVTHHPLLFQPCKQILADQLSYWMVQKNINLISLHTNLDKKAGGVNDCLARELGLVEVEPLQNSLGMGRIGELPQPCSAAQWALRVKEALGCQCVRYTPTCRTIQRAAVLGGSGEFALQAAIDAGADALVTGEGRHHLFLEALQRDFCLLDAGHFESERVVCNLLVEKLQEGFASLEVLCAQQGSPVQFV